MIEKLKNWWISIMPSIGLAPVVEEPQPVTDYEKFHTILTYLGVVHGYGSYDASFDKHIIVRRDCKADLVDIKFDKHGRVVSVENIRDAK